VSPAARKRCQGRIRCASLILSRCNAGDANACQSRSTCTPAREAELSRQQNRACGQAHTCTNENLTCLQIIERYSRGQVCLESRLAVVNECYQGVADRGHPQNIRDEVAINTCRDAFNNINPFLPRNRGLPNPGCDNQGYSLP
jgi:hypothetical protein